MAECMLGEKCGVMKPHTSSDCFLSHAVTDREFKELLSIVAGIRERAAVFATGDAGRPRKSATGACAWIVSECDGALAKFGAQTSVIATPKDTNEE